MFQHSNSAQWLLCLVKPPRISQLRELWQVPQFQTGDLHGKLFLVFLLLLQRGTGIDVWVSVLLAWLPPVSSKFYKMLFGVMVSIRLNRAVVLSKAQINSCWHSQNTSPPLGKYHLMTELMKGLQTSNTSTIYKKGMLYMVITLFGKTFLLLFSFTYFSHPFHTSSSTLDPSR